MRALPLLAATLAGLAGCLAAAAHAQPAVRIERSFLGSGQPGQSGYENATVVANDVYHAPQYLPGSPTAATIWPRVVDVPCSKSADGALQCSGYHWLPRYGRAEYLYFRPVIAAAPRTVAPDVRDAAPPPPAAPAPQETPKLSPRRSRH